MAVSVSERGHIIRGACKGRLGNQGRGKLGEPRGATAWTLHINNNSKNPSKQSLVIQIHQNINTIIKQ